MTGERVEEIQGRLSAATPGPWWCVATGESAVGPDWAVMSTNDCVTTLGPDGYQPADAEFIAHAPDDVAWLLKENGRLRVTIEELVAIGRAKAGMVEEIRAALEGTDDE